MTTFFSKVRKTIFVLFIPVLSYGQTNIKHPNPIDIRKGYSENFDHMTRSYPEGWTAWIVHESQQSGFYANPRVQEAVKDAPAIQLGNASSKGNFIYSYEGKLGFKNGQYSDYALVVSLNTKSVKKTQRVKVGFDAMIIRNLYDKTNNLVFALCLQYRIGEEGPFYNLGETVRNGVTKQTSANNPIDLQHFIFELPLECNKKPVVQLRWITKYISGVRGDSESRPSFAIDNFTAKPIL